jgi:hypothetical protein
VTAFKCAAHLALLAALLLAGNASAHAQAPNQVALVIQYGDGTVSTHCVAFDEPEIRGLDALLRAGLPVIYEGSGGMGARVCKIGPDGCDNPGTCFCQCKGTRCLYWSYWHLIDGAWQYSIIGASIYKAQPGTVEGWVWDIGTPQDAPQPPVVSFEEVCRAPTATAAPTSTPVPVPTGTPTPVPTSTPASTVTATPRDRDTETPAPTATAEQTAPPTHTSTPIPPTGTAAQVLPATATPAPGASGRGYVAFGGIVIVLGAIGIFVLRRRQP